MFLCKSIFDDLFYDLGVYKSMFDEPMDFELLLRLIVTKQVIIDFDSENLSTKDEK